MSEADNQLRDVLEKLNDLKTDVGSLFLQLETIRQSQKETSLILHEISLDLNKRRKEKEDFLHSLKS